MRSTVTANQDRFLVRRSHALRCDMTPAERVLWDRLRGKQVAGLKFRRQQVIGRAIADFYCHSARLVVEVDGDVHDAQRGYDGMRDAELRRLGIKVLRFTNSEVVMTTATVLSRIVAEAAVEKS